MIGVLLVTADGLLASLKWESVEVSQAVDPASAEATASFPFKNDGMASVTITEVKASCGCTTAGLEKKTYAPGESGVIKATLHIGARQGLQSTTIRVMTDQADEKPTVLTMKTLIPRILDIKPTFVFWTKDAVPEAKKIKLVVGLDEPVHIVSAISSNPNMTANLVTVTEGKEYTVEVFPLTTDEVFQTTIVFKTDYPREKPKTFYVQAHVK